MPGSSLSFEDYLQVLAYVKDRKPGEAQLGIGFVEALRELDATGNHLTALPRKLEDCSNLRVLRLGRNRLRAIPRRIGDRIHHQGARKRDNWN